jgi:sugar lactone lactonase YvrE
VDDNHLAIFGSGPASVAAVAFDTTFARVANPDGEFTSAITAPSLPSEFAAAVAGVHGLQPHLRPHHLARPPSVTPAVSGSATYLPAQILTAYQATNLGLTGSGQTIAIYANEYPASADLTAFWTRAGFSNSALQAMQDNIVQVNIEGGPQTIDSGALLEASLDVEWASAVAPGAIIRIYGVDENDDAAFDLTFQQVYADLPANPTLHIFSISFGGPELEIDQDYLVIEAQYMANLASAGVTVFAAAGDGGSTPDNILQVEYPACDPNVTGVGGTSLVLDSNNAISSETVWNDKSGSTGGGSSAVYARPSWQTGVGVPAGSFRLVPDVAGPADTTYGALVIQGGNSQTVGGTSWATPLWAGFAALINQSRASAGQGPLGALNPRLYPQLGTTAFHDITSGNNGTYSATVGYDRVTGLGSPNVAALIQSGLNGSPPLAIAAQLPAVFTVIGQPATFDVVASGTAPFTYQWQRLAAGASTWANLSDDGNYAGTAAALMVINQPTYAMNGDNYRCVVSNANSSVAGAATALTVSPVGVTTLAGWPDSAGRVNGTGFTARFDFIDALTTDSSGNLYVADAGNTLRYVTAAGVVTTIAGQPGVAGWQDGTGTGALFNDPAGVALDPQGNIYVADAADYTVRKVTSAGVVTTFAGKGNTQGSANGTGTLATFTAPSALVADSAGTLYLADGNGNTIRKITTPGAVVTTLAGTGSSGLTNGAAANARFNDPQGVAVDSAGNVYVGDTGNNCIRLISKSTGQVSVFAGSTRGAAGSSDGTGTAALFNGPAGLRVDASGNVYVCDAGNGTIRMISPQGVVTTISGTVGADDSKDGVNSVAAFDLPGDLTLGAGGVIYVGDTANYTIRRVVPGLATAPQLTTQPTSLSLSTGQTATFAVAISSTATAPLAYQWQVETGGSSSWSNLSDGGVYSGSATAILTVSPATVPLSGNQYRCLISNPAGSVTSSAALLTVLGPPVVASGSQNAAIAVGGSITLAANATGSGLSYQWYLNSQPISGATNSTLAITNFSSANAGTYTVTVTNSYGSTTATIAVLSTGGGRLINLSARSVVNEANPLLTVGLILGGGGTKTLLLRGIGPTLATFGIGNALADPQLRLLNGAGVQLAYNAVWGDTSALAAAFTQTGAFPLSASSADDALLVPGLDATTRTSYTAQESSLSGGSGAALNEIYDADTVTTAARLLNLSVLGSVSPGSPLIAGFVVGGLNNESETVLIRGSGPALANFGIANYLANPVLTVFGPSGTVLITNSAWSSNGTAVTTQLTSVFNSVGAFPLSVGSNDTAVLLTLAPGNYTANVVTANGTSGQALIEIYEVSQ